jgi:hypothetical protein
MRQHINVIPAKAGIHLSTARAAELWVPAFADMTNVELRAGGLALTIAIAH